jgi:hypothetical protein
MQPSSTSESAGCPALQQELQAQQEFDSNKVRVFLLLKEDYLRGIFREENLPGNHARAHANAASQFFDVWQGFYSRQRCKQARQPMSFCCHPLNRHD